MSFYIQYLSLLNCWHLRKATNIQWTLQDGEWKSTKIWQHSPLTGSRQRLSVKGSCHGYSKLCCDTPWKRRNLKHKLMLNYQKLWEKTTSIQFCKHFWFSEMLPTHYTLSLLLDFWLLTISKVHPLINLLAAFMFLWTPMSPSFRTQMFSKNAFQSNFKLLKEAES